MQMLQTYKTEQDRQENGPIAYGEPFYKWSPKNGSPYPIRLLSVCLSVCLSCLSCLSVTLGYCGQRVGWIKLKLGIEVSLAPATLWRCVRWDPAHPKRGTASPRNFRPMPVVTKRLDGSTCHLVWR